MPVDNYALPAVAKRAAPLAGDRVTRRSKRKEQLMLDVILLVVGLGFFALSIAYAFGCEHL